LRVPPCLARAEVIDQYTSGLTEALARAREIAPDVAATAAAAGLDAGDVQRFFNMFRATPRVVTCFSQGVNQSAQGTDKVNAIVNCHLATGRIGKTGMGPFSLTGQPNAMGGREVGGLANQLAAHMDFTPLDIDRVGRFWGADNIARREGLKAVPLFEAVERGQIKALWVMATNPAVSLPRAAAVRRALGKLDLFVVSENVLDNDTVNAGAQLLLPAAAWGEKGGTVTNSERRISRQRPFLPLPGEAQPDWWIVTKVAHRLGFARAFPYQTAADIFREHAALSAFENDGMRDFDLGALASLSDEAFDRLEPVQWPVRRHELPAKRLFGNGGYFTKDGKARLIAVERPAPKGAISRQFRFWLNTGRVRDQWHTMTRSGLSPRLAGHLPEPFVEVHPRDAATAKLTDGGFALVSTPHGSCTLKVVVSPGQQRGSLFVPIHWSDATASAARVCDLVAPICDPYSGQPEAKATPAAIAPVTYRHRGFALGVEASDLPQGTWWTRVTLPKGVGLHVAGDHDLQIWRARAGIAFGDAELAEYLDETGGVYRVAAFSAGRLRGCIFIGPAAAAPRLDAVSDLYAADALQRAQRQAVLAGRQAGNCEERGPQVCACFGVARSAIEAAIAQGARSADDIGAAVRAGTNCGSCLPEIKAMLNAVGAKPVELSDR
jgi:assimilatory nitrate reductase catalytic subunit